MTDRELLERAAKAAGLTITGWPQLDYCTVSDGEKSFGWAPLIFDSDALRLAVKLRMDIAHFKHSVRVNVDGYEDCIEGNESDPYAATRRAIVRAAAEMAK